MLKKSVRVRQRKEATCDTDVMRQLVMMQPTVQHAERGGEVISTTWDLPWRRPQTTRHAAVLHVLTDFELPMYSLHVAVSVLGLDGVTVAHQLHKLLGQDAVLEGRNHLDHHAAVLLYASSTCGAIWINSSVPACIFVVTTSIYTQWYSWLKLMQY